MNAELSLERLRQALEQAGAELTRAVPSLIPDRAPALPAALIHTERAPLALLGELRQALAPEHTPVWLGGPETLPQHRERAMGGAPPGSALARGARVHAALAGGAPLIDVLDGIATLPARGLERGGGARLSLDDPTRDLSQTARALPPCSPSEPPLATINPATGRPHARLLVGVMPHQEAWSAPAYLSFGGVDDNPSPAEHVGVLRWWQDQWGAELVALGPEGSDVLVRRRPSTLRQAFELAQLHLDYCPGVIELGAGDLTQLAHALMRRSIWSFLW